MENKMTDSESPRTLEALRSQAEALRTRLRDERLTPEERILLEETAAGLREAERVLLLELGETFSDRLREAVVPLQQTAARIREASGRLNQKARALNDVETLVKSAVRLISAVAAWK